MAESEEELKNHLMRVKEESEKADLKINLKKKTNNWAHASGRIISWQIGGKKWNQWQILFSRTPKSLWMMTAAMKLKDTYSLEGKL